MDKAINTPICTQFDFISCSNNIDEMVSEQDLKCEGFEQQSTTPFRTEQLPPFETLISLEGVSECRNLDMPTSLPPVTMLAGAGSEITERGQGANKLTPRNSLSPGRSFLINPATVCNYISPIKQRTPCTCVGHPLMASSPLYQTPTARKMTFNTKTNFSQLFVTPNTASRNLSYTLNSGGEETSSAFSSSVPRVPHNTPVTDGSIELPPTALHLQTINFDSSGDVSCASARTCLQMSSPPTKKLFHNEKEKYRRLRVKNACSTMKTIIPGLNDKTNRASVLELAVLYVRFVNNTVSQNYGNSFTVCMTNGNKEDENSAAPAESQLDSVHI